MGAYLLAVLHCQCGLPTPLQAARTLISFDSLEFFVFVPLAVMMVEALFTGWKNSSLAVLLGWGRSVQADILYYLIQASVLLPAIIVATTGGIYWHLNNLATAQSLKLGIIGNPVLQCAVIFVVGDFVAYWIHRWFHIVSALWEAHKVHHSGTELNIMMEFRFHPIEKAVWEATNIFFFLLLGATTETFVTFSFINMLLGQVQHSRLNISYGPLDWILVSPAFHRLHHSTVREDHDKNYGARLVVWDKLFGTYSAKKLRIDEIGVDDNTYVRNSLWSEFFRPYYVLCRDAGRGLLNLARLR